MAANRQIAEKILIEVKDYLDQTARKHNCAGFDCKLCALNGDRYVEALAEVEKVLEKEMMVTITIETMGGPVALRFADFNEAMKQIGAANLQCLRDWNKKLESEVR